VLIYVYRRREFVSLGRNVGQTMCVLHVVGRWTTPWPDKTKRPDIVWWLAVSASVTFPLMVQLAIWPCSLQCFPAVKDLSFSQGRHLSPQCKLSSCHGIPRGGAAPSYRGLDKTQLSYDTEHVHVPPVKSVESEVGLQTATSKPR
jgi:hypothetical protein